MTKCPVKRKAEWRVYYLKNKMRLCEERKRLYKENPEKNREACRRYTEKNKAKISAKRSEYRLIHQDRIATKAKRYHEKNREQCLARARDWKRRNRKRVNEYTNKWKKSHGGFMKWHLENPEKSKACSLAWFEKNRKRELKKARMRTRAWVKSNPDKVGLWKKNNRAHATMKQNIRHALKLRAMPPWVDEAFISIFYEEAARLTLKTGIKHHVDHIWPLRPRDRKFVGLHVPWNLQILTQKENSQKHNLLPHEVPHLIKNRRSIKQMNIQALMMLIGLLVFATTGISWAAEAVDVSTGALAAVADPGIWGSVESILDKLISILSNPLMAKIVTIVLGLLGGGKWLKNRAVQRWAELAFRTVEEMARNQRGKEELNKVAVFSEVFRGYMKRAGWSKLVTKADVEQAHAIAKAINIIAVKGEAFLKDKKPQ